MQLKGFQTWMYRSIIDSGWVEVTPLTVVVGKNEVGKTSLLRALHKLNPFVPEPYSMDSEWPRGRRQERDPKKVACLARFSLTDTELAEIRKMSGQDLPPKEIAFSRNYGGDLFLNLPWTEETLPESPPTSVLEPLAAGLPSVPHGVGSSFNARATELVEEARRTILEGRPKTVAPMAARHAATLQTLRSPGTPQLPIEQQFEAAYAEKLAGIAEAISKAPSPRKLVFSQISRWLPTFVYMSDYRSFTGSAQLDQVLERQKRKALTDEDKTLLTILKLSGLTLEKEVEKGNQADREQRQYDLDDASATLTKTISDRWGQRRYKVSFRGDGQLFYTFVQDEHDPSLIKLEERSKGFQWFFSFDLMFMNESKGTFANCVILLDEPGLSLHPSAQRDLLRRMEEYGRENTLIYTTHLPFMIDLAKPERIRVLSETKEGTKVSSDLTKSQPEASFVLEAALGMDGRTSYLLSRRNLVVEGADDYWLINELSNLFRRSGRPAIPVDVFITPAGGASKTASIATLMIGQKLDVVVLLDADRAGTAAREQLVKNWITRYQSSKATVTDLAQAVGSHKKEFAIEDLFPDEFYLKFVGEQYAKELQVAGVDKLELKGDDQLSKRVDRALRELGIKFEKSEIALRIRDALGRMESADELPSGTLEMTEKLVRSLAEALTPTQGQGASIGH